MVRDVLSSEALAAGASLSEKRRLNKAVFVFAFLGYGIFGRYYTQSLGVCQEGMRD